MRQYQNFAEALNEIKRELREMGVLVKTKSGQNKNIEGNEDFTTTELEDYVYIVTSPDYDRIPKEGLDEEWCWAEFAERIGKPVNPGKAWELRRPYWEQFLNRKGEFDYSYPQRMHGQITRILDLLSRDPSSRRAFLPIWDREDDMCNALGVRVPCSLGYHFKFRQGKLNMTYFLRSSDYFEHLPNDLWLACRLQYFIADELNMRVGHFVHHVGSLHCFLKDVKDVF